MKQWARATDVLYYKSILISQEQEQEQPTTNNGATNHEWFVIISSPKYSFFECLQFSMHLS